MLEVTVIVAGDGAGADIGPLPHKRIAEIGEVVGLGAGPQHDVLRLDEVAYPRLRADATAGPEPRERTDHRPGFDAGPRNVREGVDLNPIGHLYPGAEDNVGADDDVAAKASVEAEPDAGGIDQRGTLLHGPAAQSPLQHSLCCGQLGAAVDADQLLGRRLQ